MLWRPHMGMSSLGLEYSVGALLAGALSAWTRLGL